MSALAAIRRVWLQEPEPEPCRAGNIDQSSGVAETSLSRDHNTPLSRVKLLRLSGNKYTLWFVASRITLKILR